MDPIPGPNTAEIYLASWKQSLFPLAMAPNFIVLPSARYSRDARATLASIHGSLTVLGGL